MPIERFILQVSIKYQVIGLKALLWYQAWSEDFSMPYAEKAMDMYSILESTIVNAVVPAKYHQNNLIKGNSFEPQQE